MIQILLKEVESGFGKKRNPVYEFMT